jgi:hypothetical protein
VELSQDDIAELAGYADLLKAMKALLRSTHQTQRRAWERYLAKGVAKAEIARASGVTAMTVTYALTPPPSRRKGGASADAPVDLREHAPRQPAIRSATGKAGKRGSVPGTPAAAPRVK